MGMLRDTYLLRINAVTSVTCITDVNSVTSVNCVNSVTSADGFLTGRALTN